MVSIESLSRALILLRALHAARLDVRRNPDDPELRRVLKAQEAQLDEFDQQHSYQRVLGVLDPRIHDIK